jgi:hypothetical protein
MSKESKKLAGILLVVFPTVIYGGFTLLNLLINKSSGYMDNAQRQIYGGLAIRMPEFF